MYPFPEGQRRFLFTTSGLIDPRATLWRAPDGTPLPLIDPPGSPVLAHADPSEVPYGVRFEAKKPRLEGPLDGEGPSFAVLCDVAAGRGGTSGGTLRDGSVLRSWKLHPQYPPGKDFGSYARAPALSVEVACSESEDGYAWREVHRCPIVSPAVTGFDGCGVFLDPLAPPSERYKLVYMARPPAEKWAELWRAYAQVHPRWRHWGLSGPPHGLGACVYYASSGDGLDWTAAPQPLMVHHSDTDTTVYYDQWLSRYVMYTRLLRYGRRWIGRAEAEDFTHWGPVEPLVWPSLEDPIDYDVYLNGRCEYPWLPHAHLMFPMFYHRRTEQSDVRLFTSDDGICWSQMPGGPLVGPGLNGAQSNIEYLHAGKPLFPLGADRVGLTIRGSTNPHKYPRWKGRPEGGGRWMASWEDGRLCGLVADQDGAFWTFAVTPAGRTLRLNARIARSGMIRVGLQTMSREARCVAVPGRTAADCDPVRGDDLALTVRWRGEEGIAAPEGVPLALRFELRRAELFGFEWV